MSGTENRPIPKPVWIITWIAALTLLAFTIVLAIKASGQAGLGLEVYLTSPTGLVHIHEEPSMYASRVTIVSDGTLAVIRDIEPVGDTVWYFVEVETGAGWVDETRVSSEAP
jgi:hypothetical protein